MASRNQSASPVRPGHFGPVECEDCMNAKALCTCALVLAVLGEYAARADDPPKPTVAAPGPAPAAQQPVMVYGGSAGAGSAAVGGAQAVPGHGAAPSCLGSWLGCGCQDAGCGSCGTGGCIFGEFHVATGVSFPIEGGVFDKVLHEGWTIQAGFRADFFNVAQDAAWTVDFSVSHTHNQADSNALAVPLVLPKIDPNTGAIAPPALTTVSIHSLDRTYGNLTFGRDWYLNGSAVGPGWKWRAGFDAGARWGTANVDLEDVNTLV